MEEHNKNYKRLKEVEVLAIQETTEILNKKQKSVNNYVALKEKLSELPDKLSYNIMVPFGSKAFMPGSLRNTNSVTMLLGDNWFAKMSTRHACGVVQRRIEVLSESVQVLQNQKELLENKLTATSDFVELQRGDDVVEIKEEYDDEEEERWKKKRKAAHIRTKLKNETNETDNKILSSQQNDSKKAKVSMKEIVSFDGVVNNENEDSPVIKEEGKMDMKGGLGVVSDCGNFSIHFFENDDDEKEDDVYENENEQNIWNLIEEISRMNNGEVESGREDDGGAGRRRYGVGDNNVESDVIQEWVSRGGDPSSLAQSIVMQGDFSSGEEEENESEDECDDNIKEVRKRMVFKHTHTKACKSPLHTTIQSPSDIYHSFKRSNKKTSLKKKVVSFLLFSIQERSNYKYLNLFDIYVADPLTTLTTPGNQYESFCDSVSYSEYHNDKSTSSSPQSSSSLQASSSPSQAPSKINDDDEDGDEKITKFVSRFKRERMKMKEKM